MSLRGDDKLQTMILPLHLTQKEHDQAYAYLRRRHAEGTLPPVEDGTGGLTDRLRQHFGDQEMTAYLQPGDKIHLAFPVDSNQGLTATTQQAGQFAQEFIAQYAKLGVEVVLWSSNSALTHPVVVSVIRSPKAVPVPPWQALHPDPQ